MYHSRTFQAKSIEAKGINLVLFFTRGSSLTVWHESGLLSREVKPYVRLAEMGATVTFVTYGDGNDLGYSRRLPGIRIICNQWNLPQRFYVWLLPVFLRVAAGKEWVGKSNQCLGAEIGLAAAGKAHRFIVRNGYLLSQNEERSHGVDSVEAQKAHKLEEVVFLQADSVVVTTESMKTGIVGQYGTPPDKILVIPNYVDVQTFRPSSRNRQTKFTIGYVGRLVENKNPFALLSAIQGLNVNLVVVGGGGLAKRFEEQAGAQGSSVELHGFVPNELLPQILNSCDLFVLPSLYEGHPKALLEAMACGLPVIATDVPGNRELITHKSDGYLCGTSSREIRNAIITLMNDETLRQNLGKKARERIEANFSLERVLELELELLRQLSS